jgi:hypothetical protein
LWLWSFGRIARSLDRLGEEGTDGEERDQAIGDAAKDDQQERGEAYQRNDAVRVKQAAPAAASRPAFAPRFSDATV